MSAETKDEAIPKIVALDEPHAGKGNENNNKQPDATISLNNRIVAIEKKMQKTSYFKDPPFLLSVVACIISIVTSIYGFEKQTQQIRSDEFDKKRELVSIRVNRLIEIDNSYYRSIKEHPEMAYDLSGGFNAQRQIAMDELIEASKDITDSLSTNVLLIISVNCRRNGRWKETAEFGYSSFQRAHDSLSVVFSCRNLAEVFGSKTSPLFDTINMKYWRSKEIVAARSLQGILRLAQVGNSFAGWAASDILSGNKSTARDYLDSAKFNYLEYLKFYPQEKFILAFVDSLYIKL